MQVVKIPEERKKTLINHLEEIEEQGGVSLEISDEEGVMVSSEDPIAEWKSIDVIKAIGRGFEPNIAMRLFGDDYVLKIINLKDLFDKEKQRIRVKSRVIGTEGKTRATIEEISGASVRVYGNTVSIIGKPEEAALAGQAVEKLVAGASHGTVYFFLQKERRKMAEEPM